jgi:N-methylhydantoinase A
MEEKGRADIKAAAPHSVDIMVKHAADMRYVGQEHAVTVEVPGELFAKRDIAGIKARFDAVHQVRYGYASADENAEIVSLRLSVTGVIGKPSQAPLAAASGKVDDALIGVRPVEFGVLGGRIDTPIYSRDKLSAGHAIAGPALIQEYASTTVLAPGDRLTVDPFGNLDITVDVQS